jgi:hypothetical protein
MHLEDEFKMLEEIKNIVASNTSLQFTETGWQGRNTTDGIEDEHTEIIKDIVMGPPPTDRESSTTFREGACRTNAQVDVLADSPAPIAVAKAK